MELIRGTHTTSKCDPKDFIIVVTNILDRLPLQDAVMTSILSTNWRFKWTLLSQLMFDLEFFQYLSKTKGENNYGRIINRLLLHLKGTITKFDLYIDEESELEDEDINHWIFFLSGKGIKNLTIWKCHSPPLKLPTHLFSCLELKHLKLNNCCFDPPASFHGFPNLLSLELAMVQVKSSKFGEFITWCSLLESLSLRLLLQPPNTDNVSLLLGKVKLVEIAKLANLKKLYISLGNLDNTLITSSGSIYELVGFLPKLQELHLDFKFFKFRQGAHKKRSPTFFPCLMALTLTNIDLGTDIMLSCAFELIRCSTNLQTLAIETSGRSAAQIPEVEYNTIVSLQLQTVVFRGLKGLESEVCLIKYILECSPFLKKIVIHPHSFLAPVEKLFTRKLLKLHRASPVAEIDLY